MNNIAWKYTRIPYHFRAPNDTLRTAQGHLVRTPSVKYQLDAQLVGQTSGFEVKAKELYKIIWAVKNSGSTPWPPKCRIVITYVPVSDSQTSFLKLTQLFLLGNPEVPPGETYKIQFAITVPDAKGIYHRRWRLVDPNGKPFGPALRTDFHVI
jgi:hypothetical protein